MEKFQKSHELYIVHGEILSIDLCYHAITWSQLKLDLCHNILWWLTGISEAQERETTTRIGIVIEIETGTGREISEIERGVVVVVVVTGDADAVVVTIGTGAGRRDREAGMQSRVSIMYNKMLCRLRSLGVTSVLNVAQHFNFDSDLNL